MGANGCTGLPQQLAETAQLHPHHWQAPWPSMRPTCEPWRPTPLCCRAPTAAPSACRAWRPACWRRGGRWRRASRWQMATPAAAAAAAAARATCCCRMSPASTSLSPRLAAPAGGSRSRCTGACWPSMPLHAGTNSSAGAPSAGRRLHEVQEGMECEVLITNFQARKKASGPALSVGVHGLPQAAELRLQLQLQRTSHCANAQFACLPRLQGLRRYRLGDRLRCSGFWGNAPKVGWTGLPHARPAVKCALLQLTRFTCSHMLAFLAQFVFVGRAGQAINLINENTSEEQLALAVAAAAADALPGGCLDLQVGVGRAGVLPAGPEPMLHPVQAQNAMLLLPSCAGLGGGGGAAHRRIWRRTAGGGALRAVLGAEPAGIRQARR